MLDDKEYYKEWLRFMESSLKGQMGVPEILEYLVKFINYHAIANDVACNSEKIYKLRVAEIGSQKDDNGKIISSAKSEQISESTEEYFKFREAKTDKENILSMIEGLKSMQFGTKKEQDTFVAI